MRRYALRDEKKEVLGNTDHAFHLDRRAVVGNPPDYAINRRLTEARDYFAGQKGTAAKCRFLLGHGRYPKWFRLLNARLIQGGLRLILNK